MELDLSEIKSCLNVVIDDVCKKLDEFDYVKGPNFTSEIYKIQISNLPKYIGFGEFKKAVKRTLGFAPHKMKHIRNFNKMYVTFKNEEQKQIALDKLNQFKFKGKILEVRSAKPQEDAMLKRPSTDSENASDKRRRLENEKLTIEDVATPWHKIPYDQQLQDKQKDMRQTLAKMTKEIMKTNLEFMIKEWLELQQSEYEGMCCPMNDILPSPVINYYRNKCEFTVGLNVDGEKSVGFRLKRYINQSCAVGEPQNLININATMKVVVDRFQQFIRCSKKDVYNPQNFQGHWRQLTVRTNENGEALVIVMVLKNQKTENLTISEQEEISSEKIELQNLFSATDSPVKSLLYIRYPPHHPAADAPQPKLEIIFGDGNLNENLLGHNFRISPDAFFQCNTHAASVLYKNIGGILQKKVFNEDAKKNVVLFDVCCGTGTIGITLAKYVKKVIGVEMCAPAVEDAKINAKINQISNIEFHCGKAEDLLGRLMDAEQLEAAQNNEDGVEFVAILDPPRPGTHQTVIKTLRKCNIINKIIYVSCNPKAVTNNFIDLCRARSKRLQGDPFKPTNAQPVDLFPHTPHCELIVVFERVHS